jgi:hypothetical protein
MKHSVGDKVKIREDLIVGKMYGVNDFARGMQQYKGAIATITNVFPKINMYHINIDEDADIRWKWTDEMFEEITELESKDEKTVDVGYHLEYCGHRVIKNVYYGGYAHDHEHIFCTTADYHNQYTLPIDAIDFIIPHED